MPSQLPIIRSVTRRDGRRIVDLSESSNLYLTAQQGRWFERVVRDELYSKELWILFRERRVWFHLCVSL